METIAVPRDFKEFVELHRARIYDTIVSYISKNYAADYAKIIRVYVDRKGQYRRPSYLLLWTLLYSGNIEDAILPAAVQQTSEDWILMLDDFMDQNGLRRGGPTAHTMFGANLALNASSHLHVINWRMVFDAVKQLGDKRGDRYFNKFYDIMDVTHVGQYLDLTLTSKRDITKFSLDEYYASIHGKAAYYTVYGPMQAGAIVAGADEEIVKNIPEYGIPVGQAFQIKDDILDCTSTNEILGKTVGNDVMDGTKTLILWHAVQNAPANTLERLKKIYAKNRTEKTKEEIDFVLSTFKELGSLDYAQHEAERQSNEALLNFDRLTAGIPESDIKNLARDSISNTVKRVK